MATSSLAKRYCAEACLMASAPDLLLELKMAHLIIRNALACMTTAQKIKWGELNAAEGLAGEGSTRANERNYVIHNAIFNAEAQNV